MIPKARLLELMGMPVKVTVRSGRRTIVRSGMLVNAGGTRILLENPTTGASFHIRQANALSIREVRFQEVLK